MKKLICTLFAAALICSGCIKTEETVLINKDKSAEISDSLMVDEQYVVSDDTFSRAIITAQNKYSDVEITNVGKKGFVGKKFTYKIKDITKSNAEQIPGFHSRNEGGIFLQEKKGFFKTRYIVDAEFDIPHTARDISGTMGRALTYEQISYIFNSEFKIKTPIKAVMTNATTSDDENMMYTWTLSTENSTPIKLEYDIYHIANIVWTSIFGVLAGLIMLFKIYKFFKKESPEEIKRRQAFF